MAKQIQSVAIWNNGNVSEALWLGCICVNDNLSDQAIFSYNLFSDLDGQPNEVLANGTVTMQEPEYSQWTDNDFAYNFVAEKLSITIIN